MAITYAHTQAPWLRFRSSDPVLVSLTALCGCQGLERAFERLYSVHVIGGRNVVIFRIHRGEDTKIISREKGKLETTNVSPNMFKGTSPGKEGESRSCPSLHNCKAR